MLVFIFAQLVLAFALTVQPWLSGKKACYEYSTLKCTNTKDMDYVTTWGEIIVCISSIVGACLLLGLFCLRVFVKDFLHRWYPDVDAINQANSDFSKDLAAKKKYKKDQNNNDDNSSDSSSNGESPKNTGPKKRESQTKDDDDALDFNF